MLEAEMDLGRRLRLMDGMMRTKRGADVKERRSVARFGWGLEMTVVFGSIFSINVFSCSGLTD